jgi:hypothetical protein
MISKKIYLDAALPQFERLLSQLNKNEASDYFGCFDKQYWHYRIRDFPGTISQYATLTLALVYNLNVKENKYYKDPALKKWVEAAMLFWVKMQNKDGSFDESWPGDRSQPATAFSLCFVGRAFLLMKNELSPKTINKMICAFKKAAEIIWNKSEVFGAKRGDPEVPNHDAGSVLALELMYHITKDSNYRKKSKIYLKELINLQTKEGYFPEYGGADIGYNTTMLFFLTNYYKLSNNKDILSQIKKLIKFTSYFIHPDGSLGGTYGSRTTYFCLPSGFEIMSKEIPLAKSISEKIKEGINHETTLTPRKLDDDNIKCFIYISYFDAYNNANDINKLELGGGKLEKLPCEKENFQIYFPKSKLFVINKKDYYGIMSGTRGGILSIYSKKGNNKVLYKETGYVADYKNIKIVSTIISTNNKVSIKKNIFESVSQFSKVNFVMINSLNLIISRIIFTPLSYFPIIKKIIKKTLKKMLMTGNKRVQVQLKRYIEFKDNEISIHDQIKSKNSRLKKLMLTNNFTNFWTYPEGCLERHPLKPHNIFIKETKNAKIKQTITFGTPISKKVEILER